MTIRVVFTTVLHGLRAEQILTAYRARWQVELDFKRSKTIRELDSLPNFLPETTHSWCIPSPAAYQRGPRCMGAIGSSRGFAVESAHRCTGWEGSRDASPLSSRTGVSARHLRPRSEEPDEARVSRPVL
jgi:hypothetical protein